MLTDKNPAASAALTSLSFEQLRKQVLEEAHKRPFITVHTPCRVSHLVYLHDQRGDTGAGHIQQLLEQADTAENSDFAADDSCQFGQFSLFTLRWEKHTEFSTYTIIVAGPGESPFARDCALSYVPEHWLESIPGQRLAAFHLLITDDLQTATGTTALSAMFTKQTVYGGELMAGRARVWTSFKPHHDDEFNRFVIETLGLDPTRSGRLLQNVLELETYRLLALLTFPLARELTPQVRQIDQQLLQLVEALANTPDEAEAKPLLGELLALATAIEGMRARSNYRFNATRAYASLVRKRLKVLRESRPDSQTSLTEFLERRFSPAIDTCNAVESQLQGLSRRITRAGDLLRTRIDLDIQHQNQQLLTSMDRRASLQLHLQQTVEGLSIFAISYYLMGLVAYALKPWQPGKWVTAALVPVVLAGVWLMVRGVRKQIHKKQSADQQDN